MRLQSKSMKEGKIGNSRNRTRLATRLIKLKKFLMHLMNPLKGNLMGMSMGMKMPQIKILKVKTKAIIAKELRFTAMAIVTAMMITSRVCLSNRNTNSL